MGTSLTTTTELLQATALTATALYVVDTWAWLIAGVWRAWGGL